MIHDTEINMVAVPKPPLVVKILNLKNFILALILRLFLIRRKIHESVTPYQESKTEIEIQAPPKVPAKTGKKVLKKKSKDIRVLFVHG